jgi:nucleotide-binding universal stress UspA family protein
MPVRSILTLVDFSEGSRAAVRRAALIAREADAELQLLHAYGPRGVVSSAVFSAIGKEASRELDALAEELERGGVRTSGRLHPGSVSEAFEQTEDELHPDLVVVGARGHSALRRIWAGSVADFVVQHAFSPVLVVRGPADAEPDPFSRILAATDFSDHSHAAAAFARELAPRTAARHLVHVRQVPYAAVAAMGSGVVDDWREKAQAKLDSEASELEAVPHLLDGSPPHQIARIARELGCDLIVLGTRGEGTASWLAPGSVAAKTVHLAEVSVLTLRAAGSSEPVREALQEVRSELSDAANLPDDARHSLGGDLREIRHLAEDSRDLERELLDIALEEFELAIARFELSHPRLVDATGRLVRTLGRMGI